MKRCEWPDSSVYPMLDGVQLTIKPQAPDRDRRSLKTQRSPDSLEPPSPKRIRANRVECGLFQRRGSLLRSQGAHQDPFQNAWCALCFGECMNESSQQATRYRRIVVLDIETVSADINVPRGALDGLSCRIVCVGLLIDDGEQLTQIAFADEDEAKILTGFWGSIRAEDLLVRHNVAEFDLLILKQRSWIHGIRPSRSVDLRRYYTLDVKDTLTLWTNWGFKKGVGLDALATALGCGQKIGHGVDVADWWGMRDLRSISEYCLQDCWVTYQVFCKLTYQEPLVRKSQSSLQSIPSAQIQERAVRRTRRRDGNGSQSPQHVRPE